MRPAQYRIERCAQLMRDSREEFILGAISSLGLFAREMLTIQQLVVEPQRLFSRVYCFLGFAVKPGVVDSQRDAMSQILGKHQVGFIVMTARLRGNKSDGPKRSVARYQRHYHARA